MEPRRFRPSQNLLEKQMKQMKQMKGGFFVVVAAARLTQ